MRQIFRLLILLTFLTSCSESFKKLDFNKFNEKIKNRTDIKTPEELIKLYYDYPEAEGTPQLFIQTINLGENKYEITLIHERLEDDSQSAEKIVMTAKQIGNIWLVIDLKENWKCWDGRGHTSWGTDKCS